MCGSVYVMATEYGKIASARTAEPDAQRACAYGIMSAANQEGLKMKELFSDASRSRIVAEINGVPVSAFQVEFKRYINAYPTDDMAILNEIARERFVLENAKVAGINISYDDIMKEILEEEAYAESEAAHGNELMIKRQKEDEELLATLGMTKEELNKEVYAEMLLYSKTFIEYGKYYYMNNISSTSFEEYIDREFNEANVMIVKYDTVKE